MGFAGEWGTGKHRDRRSNGFDHGCTSLVAYREGCQLTLSVLTLIHGGYGSNGTRGNATGEKRNGGHTLSFS